METIEELWRDDKDPEAKVKRDRRARELRKLGYHVEVETVGFSDLLRCTVYKLRASKPTAKELFQGTVLDGYIEATKVKPLDQFTEQKPTP